MHFVVIALALAVILCSALMAYVPATPHDSSLWGPSWRVSTVSLFNMLPRANSKLLDEEIYLGTLQGIKQGKGFYQAQNDMLNTNPGRWNTHSPLTYRQPLLTYIWLTLRSGALIGILYGVIAGISMLAVYSFTTRLVKPACAALAPLALGVVYSFAIIHPPRILFTEMWAAPLIVIATALCSLLLLTPNPDGRTWALSCLGAFSALLAMATRELSAIPVAIMLTALLFDRTVKARRLWTPWIACFLVWIGLYAVHTIQVQTVSSGDIAPPFTQGTLLLLYFHPGLSFLSACVRWTSTTSAMVPVVVFFCVMAIAGAWILRRTRLRLLAGGMILGIFGLLVLAGTPGTFQDGTYTGYWGFLFLPQILVWTGVGLGLLPGAAASKDSLSNRNT